MAGFAPGRRAVSALLLHAIVELTLVRIGVATRAVKIAPVIEGRGFGFEVGGFLVAVGAWDGDVTASQNEPGLFVPGDAEGRRLVALEVVAAIAGIEIWSSGKLSAVPVGVAVGARRKFDLEERVFALRNVALHAFDARMASLQRISAKGVFFHRERGGLPALHGVTGSTFAAIRAFDELSPVGIRLVAVHALGESDGLFEVSVGVTLRAIHGRMLTLQRILGFGMIKALVHRLPRNSLPPARVVAGLAALREAAMVRIPVAIRAQVEGDADILRFAVGSVHVALRALHLDVQAGQRIPRPRVVEFLNLDGFPVFEIVTLLARRTEPALMRVFMTGGAGRRKTEVGAGEVFDLNGGALRRRNPRRIVTLVAGHTGMLAFEKIAGFLVIESFDIPLDKREIFPVVLGMAPRAFLA